MSADSIQREGTETRIAADDLGHLDAEDVVSAYYVDPFVEVVEVWRGPYEDHATTV